MASRGPALCPVCEVPLAGAEKCPGCGYEPPRSHEGELVSGRFRINARLGGGGVGEVYAATDTTTGEDVAVKFLLAQWATVPEQRARFRREAMALSRLHHPGIVAAREWGEDKGELHLVMDRVRGRSLADTLFREGPLPIPRLLWVFDGITAALEAAHEAGVVHRDMKPENVMIAAGPNGEERIRVLDFGLAFMDDGQGRLTASGTVHGTPAYMSPEQCRGHEVGLPTDVYALGVMLYEAVLGDLPFNSDDMVGFFTQHMFVEPPALRADKAGRELPAGLGELVKRALQKVPSARPTVSELRNELRAIGAGTATAAVAARQLEERLQAAELPREQRAISPLPPSNAPPVSAPRPVAPDVVIWSDDEPRVRSLRDALAVNGFAPRFVDRGALPDPHATTVVVLGSEFVERTRALRAAGRETRILVVDVPGANEGAELARAGANDFALIGAGDAEICKKAWRLVRRGR